MIRTFEALREAARAESAVRIAVAAAEDDAVIEAVVKAREEGLADAVLVGQEAEIKKLLKAAGASPEAFELLPADNPAEAAAKAVRLVHDGQAGAVLKGFVSTPELMRAVLNKEYGLRSGKLITHCMLYQPKGYSRYIVDTDGGMCTFPTLEQKIGILENAAELLKLLGYEEINAAVLCAGEKVDPKIKDMAEAAEIAGMTEHWAKWNMNVYGPVGLDLAISEEACRHKNYSAKGAGKADIILVPDYQVGNCLGKSMGYFGGAENGGIILGAKAPILLVSRADPALAKMNSMALAAVVAAAKAAQAE